MRNILVVLFVFAFAANIFSSEYTGKRANAIIPGTSLVYTHDDSGFPVYFQFQSGKEIPFSKFTSWIKTLMTDPENSDFMLLSSSADKIGYVHFRYQQLYNNLPVENGIFVIHVKENKIVSFSGKLYSEINQTDGNISISSDQAIYIAKTYMNAETYKWELLTEENHLKTETGNPKASYYPIPTSGIYYSKQTKGFVQIYKLSLYAHKPIDKKEFLIDANTGKILEIRQKLYAADVPGTAVTKYSGSQTITADSYGGSYRLRETGRGNGIQTYNALTGTSYGSAVDFTDSDNYWNNVNAQNDEAATDAHWAAEKTYDYFFNSFAFNSIDNAGFALISYVHYDVNYSNAFWDGQRMTYGDGNSNPFTTVDIAAHEITHGLTEFNAGLIYQDESGALNEGYSDIFGTAIEFYAKPSSANWTMGEDLGSPFRSLQNPNAHGDPDTYFGTNWYTGTGDNGGVHTNSQVIGYWYYLLTVGGSGTNDIGNAFNVTGIGMDAASQISFRTLCTYLPVDATYEDARFFSVLSAIDIYGPCTPEVAAVTNAMYAVGLGVPYVPSVIADFSSDLTSACSAPFAVNFQNLSNNSTSFLWDFGDGTTSTLVSPTHTYTSLGNFNVSLVANGGSCGMDTTIKNSFVSISEANPCIVIMPTSGSGITQTACAGTLFDGGGPSGNYIDNADAVITISPTGATQVTIEFVLFDVEPGSGATCDYDYLEIFDGPNTSAASLGRFCNTNGSPGIINSSGGSLTIQLHSDQGLNLAGFEANWSCSLANNPPVANFTSAPASTCTGDVSFTDNSTNGPTSWMWDFGDGQTSTLQNPTHNYSANGTYNVSLTATNGFGSDNITFNNLVTVNRPLSPVVVNDTICQNEQAVLNATGNGDLNWYSASTGGTLIFSGTTFTTPSLSASATYYVENAVIASSQFVGDLRSSTVGGFFTSNVSHYLVFDCLSPCELVSVEVNAGAAGTRVIQLKNSSGTIMDAVSVNIPAGVSRINLNFSIPVGNNFQLVGPVSPNLWRNNASCTYPYQISGLISIKTSSAGTNPTNYYYYFYDWEVKEPDCISPRVPVNAEVQICQGIENDLLAGVKSFPNPVNKILSIELPVELDFKNILMKDILGNNLNTVFSLKSDNIIEVDLSSMSDGVYLIAIETTKGLMFQKIIKK